MSEPAPGPASALSDFLGDGRLPPPGPRTPGLARLWQQRFTPSGRVLLLIFLVAGSVGLSIGDGYPLHELVALLFALLFVDWAVGRIFRPRVTVEREIPARVAAGERVVVRARVTNVGRLPALDLAVTERFPRPALRLDPTLRYLDRLWPGETVELTYGLEPLRRGVHDFAGPIALSGFPFGLHHAARRLDAPARMLVYPRFAPLDAVDLPVGRKHQPGGLSLVSEVGDSGEFCGNREYRSGDRLRDVHHAAWARLGTPVVREFQQEYLCRIALVCDTHVPRRGARAAREALEAAISLGAGVADVLSRQEYVIDIFAAGPELYHFEAGRSLGHLDDILDVLACVEGCREDPFEKLGPRVRDELARISSAVLVLLDWDETREGFTRLLEQSGVATKVVIVRESPPTLDPRGFTTATGPILVLLPEHARRGAGRL